MPIATNTILVALIKLVLAALALTMSCWASMPLAGTLALAVLATISVALEIAPGRLNERLCTWSLRLAWLCTLAIPLSLVFIDDQAFSFDQFLDGYYAVLAWLVAACILPLNRGARNEQGIRWRFPVIVWALFGSMIWLVTAYFQNHQPSFYAGITISVTLLVLCHLWFRLSTLALQMVNTSILVLIGLPLADVFFHPAHRLRNDSVVRAQHYSYAAARKDPTAFARWWNYYLAQWKLTSREILTPGPVDSLPYRLRPGTTGMLAQCKISINSVGFRGREIEANKGEVFRIVVLGESTTFGITLNADHVPWPEQLEELIRIRLKPDRRVEVINAGVPGYTISDSLYRYPGDIAPVQPDMLITYHGINGFPMLYEALPSLLGNDPPAYKQRPLGILADCEYRFKMNAHRRSQTRRLIHRQPTVTNLLETAYAKAYEEMIQLAKTNGVPLVLASFSMAVNESSSKDAVEFYQIGYPTAPWLVKVNASHSKLLKLLQAKHGYFHIADTHPGIDGVHENFLDLVHLSPEGDKQMAENMLMAIKDLLVQELGARPSHRLVQKK